MKIKAVIMDGDGSTLTKNNLLPANLKEMICQNSQIKWIMATGRSLELLKKTPIYDCLSSGVPHIVDGGSCLMFLNGECKMRHLINLKSIELLFNKLILEKTNFVYYSHDGENSYAYSRVQNFQDTFKFHDEKVSYTSSITQFREWINDYPPSKILLNVTDHFDLSGLYYHQNENNFDITEQNINKGSACVELLNELGLLPSEVAFVFNDRNDLPIVEHLHLQDITKIKVGDYLPEVVADYNVKTPYDVVPILQQLI
jgi:hydroxymethylpyrimidine pyrophosphatase-like HAD family hydrolase